MTGPAGRTGHDWRLLPIAGAVWLAAFIGTSGWLPARDLTLALLIIAVSTTVSAARSGRAWLAVAIAAMTVTGVTSSVQSWQRHSSPVAELARERAVATAEVTLRAEAQPRTRATVGLATLVWVEARGSRVAASVPVVIIATGDVAQELRAMTPGATYRVSVRLGAPEPDEAAAAVLRLREVDSLVLEPGPFDAAANAMRQGLRDAVAHSPPGQAALVPSLVVGDTSGVDEDMRAAFQATGLTHLMAVSGANLTLMMGVVLAVARALGVRGWAVRVTAVGGVAGFVLVCGQEPSVLRAAAMGLVALAGIGVGGGRRSIRTLSLAVLLLLWVDPWMARSVGFALSVSACTGIVLLGPRLIGAMTRWAPRWAAEALAVPLAAQLATQPLVTGISDQVSVIGVATNVLAGPFVGPTTVLGLAAALLCWVPFLAAGPGWLAGWCSQPILWLAHGGAALPSSAWEWGADPLGVALVTLASAALVIGLPVALRSPWGALALVAAIVAGSVVRPHPIGWPGPWQVVFCDVGQGDATVLNAGGGAAVVVDAGPAPAATLDCLDSLGVRSVPLLLLTHYHADHVGGAAELISRFGPSLILVRAGPVPAWVESSAGDAGSEVRPAAAGERFSVGDVSWTTASVWETAGAAVPEAEGEGSPENDASIVGIADVSGLRVLLAGDLEPSGQAVALRRATAEGVSLAADVLKLPHHGSSRQDPRFFETTGAVVAVASSGEGNSYGHPAASTLSLARNLGMRIARTDEDGSVAVARSQSGVEIRSHG